MQATEHAPPMTASRTMTSDKGLASNLACLATRRSSQKHTCSRCLVALSPSLSLDITIAGLASRAPVSASKPPSLPARVAAPLVVRVAAPTFGHRRLRRRTVENAALPALAVSERGPLLQGIHKPEGGIHKPEGDIHGPEGGIHGPEGRIYRDRGQRIITSTTTVIEAALAGDVG
eukprot:1192947-Prorocentrum_minimum.AAC.6